MTKEFFPLPSEWQTVLENLPPLVTRKQISDLTGLVAVGTIANADSQGRGILGKRILHKKAVYPRENVVSWLMGQERPTEGRKG